MHKLKTMTLAIATTGMLALSPFSVMAQDNRSEVGEARMEGSVATAFALNRHLNPFRIQVQVQDRTAILTGTVENGVNRDLAEEVALSIEGIEEVDNQLTVDTDVDQSDAERISFANSFNDATTTATVKSKLLWNRHTQGLDIDVDTSNSVVTLTGEANSDAARELAQRLAENTAGVRDVRNNIVITDQPGTAAQAQQAAGEAASEAAEVVSDAWITSKVKSSLLFNRNLDAMDISVMSRNSRVTLSGRVDSDARKQLAIETAGNIRGVESVDAQALRVAP
ncbi:BON domain-containing protein [Halopseudomonas sp.]|uniref:BON domain-containing protein n=1 Tax=Halopseudomonas sp. TaxID=2901191 RepID=UPI003568254A